MDRNVRPPRLRAGVARLFLRAIAGALALLGGVASSAEPTSAPAPAPDLAALFQAPPAEARPWVFWYWMHAAVSRAGLTADLEAMRQAGIGGAYLVPIKGPAEPPLFTPAAPQLSPEWWALMRHALAEADRLGVSIALHASDGFATAGGPWIRPEQSMQQVVWTRADVVGGAALAGALPRPLAREGFYRDIAVLAFPALPGAGETSGDPGSEPRVTVSASMEAGAGAAPQFLAAPQPVEGAAGAGESFRTEHPGWIDYTFAAPFTARAMEITPAGGNTVQPQRLRVEASDDGVNFRAVAQLAPPRHGWHDGGAPVTHALPETTARVFRFHWDPAGSEPGAEDLDGAKWRPVLRVRRIRLLSEPRVHQFEAKNGAVWRLAAPTSDTQVPASACVDPARIIDLTDRLQPDGRLAWEAPAGTRWTILRIGHTSTGATNATGGAARGLECDKLDADAVRFQFEQWFGAIAREAGPALAARVLRTFHVDSWECGSQNWTPALPREFAQRRGYDLRPFLPVIAGIPVGRDVAEAERVLADLRQTIDDLVQEKFFGTLAALARERGLIFTAECVAPVMLADGLKAFSQVDVPMGEFWLRSPTHDKPTDILDAVSAARIYGKRVVQAEAFTQLRIAWDETPALLKAPGDLHFALGVNRLVYHVMAHNPWTNRRPGMTLDGVGLLFQRDQTWWPAVRAMTDYHARVQAVLQQGEPVVDLAVFVGDELPRRALTPDRLVPTLPGLFGPEVVARETARLANLGEPQRELPAGVRASAHLTDASEWIDPLRGYAYDSINAEVLARATVRTGRVMLASGASYAVLVVPERVGRSPLVVSPTTRAAIQRLVAAGAQVIGSEPWQASSLVPLGVEPDLIAKDVVSDRPAHGLAWTHRRAGRDDVYFVSNQSDAPRHFELSLRVTGKRPELWDPLTGKRRVAEVWRSDAAEGRTHLRVRLEEHGARLIVLRAQSDLAGPSAPPPALAWLTDTHPSAPQATQHLAGPWLVAFDHRLGGPAERQRFNTLANWTLHPDEGVRAYSGAANYEHVFRWTPPAEAGIGPAPRVWLELGRVADVAEVAVNDVRRSLVWTAPWRVDVTAALRPGENVLRVTVMNTWRNRLRADAALPPEQRVTWTNAPDRWSSLPSLPAGLLGPVSLHVE